MYTVVVQYDIRLMDGEIRAQAVTQATSNLSLLITKTVLVSRRLERTKMAVGGRLHSFE